MLDCHKTRFASVRASGCKFARFLKASPSLCTPSHTNYPVVQPSTLLRAPVAVVPRTTGGQKFESTLIQPLHNTPCNFALQNLRPFCVGVDSDPLCLRTIPATYTPIRRNILPTASPETKLDSRPAWRIGNCSIRFSAGRSEFIRTSLKGELQGPH